MSDDGQLWSQNYYAASTPFQNNGHASRPSTSYGEQRMNGVGDIGYAERPDTMLDYDQEDDPGMYNGEGHVDPQAELAKFESMMQDLMQARQQTQDDSEYRDEMEDWYRRLNSDNDMLVTQMSKWKHQVESAERETGQLRARLDSMESNWRTEMEKHKNTKEELKTIKISLQQARSQYTYEVRKRDLEMGKLKEKTQKYITDRHKAGKVGLKLLNQLGETQRPGATTSRSSATKTQDDEFFKNLLQASREKESEFSRENENLRAVLRALYEEVASLLVTSAAAADNTMDEDAMVDDSASNSGVSIAGESVLTTGTAMRTAEQLARVDLPSAIIGGAVERDVREMVARLRQQWAGMTSQALAPIDAEVLASKEQALEDRDMTIIALRKQLDEHKYVIKEQEKLMEMALSPDVMGGGDISAMMGHSSMHDVTETELNERYQSLQRQQTELEEERRKFTEAAVKLGHDREQLRRERDAFEEEKRAAEMANILDDIPTPQWLKDTPARQAHGLRSRHALDTPVRPSGLSKNAFLYDDDDDDQPVGNAKLNIEEILRDAEE
ncbi:Afadin and alpha-actinin-binding-domain-containing protein [Thamnocephalis sphaerospora]|uniref:Afadin and alpha-actinin-binding-domain-containing protein n=1 Tax=Thamnocephalis sphaerospora TaxID=78915 RepID=A0A4P9XW77_9FUNG|nr:Afadin and alpha-actinin-binding-domain-containing protein [Thamnocephalis sphaerospora]|eukprot:RKP10566.1 Afadin and alpha-actinin-binding-domain-containing protein [Thamnocephalis sphaerospora]